LHKAGYIKNKNNKINIGIPMNLIINKIKLKYISCSLSKMKQSLNKLKDLFSPMQEMYNNLRTSSNNLTENFFKIRIIFDGLICAGKSQVLNCIIGENILPIKEEVYLSRGIILKYQDTNDFYLYKAHLIEKENGSYDSYFFENGKDFDCKGVDNIRSYLINKNNEKYILDDELFFIIKEG
jgi:hypothetical protein